MKTGQCLLSFMQVRAEPSERSELVTQLIYGETYAVLEELDKWLQIETHGDLYKGFIDKKQFNDHQFALAQASINVDFPKYEMNETRKVLVPIGAFLPGNSTHVLSLSQAFDLFKAFLGAPYVWGGKTNFGYDCSGFTQIFFRCLGVSLLRDANQQATQGLTIHLLDEAKSGDLAFFDNAEGKITHVGIIEKTNDNFQVLHSSGELRIDKLDHHGVYKKNEGYSHNLRLIQRML